MKYVKFATILYGLFLYGFGVQAQSFAPQSGVETKLQPAASSTPKTQIPPSSNALKDTVQTDDAPILSDAVANFSGINKIQNEEETYDNSMGKVIEFRLIDGKIVFENDIEKRKILIYYDNFSVSRGFDNITKCSLRVYVLNDLLEKINNISFKLIWPEISTALQMNQIPPGANTYTDITLLGDGCFSMDKIPVVEVNRCRVKGKTQEQCADAVKWFVKKQN